MKIIKELSKGLRYSLYLIFHPFKGFWELKLEKRKNLWFASIILLLTIIVLIMQNRLTGYLLKPLGYKETNMILQATSILLPFLIWCISNWCITTLVDGEGKLSDIFIASAYALTPILLISIPLIIMSNVIVLDEIPFYTFFDSVSFIWAGALILIGIMTIHQFTFLKTIGTIIIALVGMACIMFLALLFFLLIQQMLNFAFLLYQELSMR